MNKYFFLVTILLMIPLSIAETPEPILQPLKVRAVCVIPILGGDSEYSPDIPSVAEMIASDLRKAEITAYGWGECPENEGTTYLFIRTDILQSGSGRLRALRVDYELEQRVQLVSDPSVTIPAYTWRDSRLGLALAKDVETVTSSFMRELTKALIIRVGN